MKVLFITNDLINGNLACQLKKEGHDVKLYIDDKDRRQNFDKLVNKTQNWKKELDWVGKNGLIIFDDVGFGKNIDELRKKGFTVFGGGLNGDLLEIDRAFGDKIFHECDLQTRPLVNFNSIDEAIIFLKENVGPWVIKQNGIAPKFLNYVGIYSDNRDVISVLEIYKKYDSEYCKVITLQKKIDGIEIATSRFFNGSDWVGPIEINMEHKKFMPGNIGPTTSEMGTIAWYTENEGNKLFTQTLAKLKPYLKKINYRGVIDINCIINENGAFPLEVTARFGSPIAHLQYEAYFTQWKNDPGAFFMNIAKGNKMHVKNKSGFGIVVLIALPPFPYSKKIDGCSLKGQQIYLEKLNKEDLLHIHFEEISYDDVNQSYIISDDRGYVLYVTSFNKSIKKAQKDVYELISKIHVPKMIFRNDIGNKFILEDMNKLKKMGYLD